MSARYLLDSHTLIWMLLGDSKLPDRFRKIIPADQPLVVSIVSFWEIAIKSALGKLEVPDDLYEIVEQSGITILAVTGAHIRQLKSLPHHHRDPFDRMLIAQAVADNLVVMSLDARFAAYDIPMA